MPTTLLMYHEISNQPEGLKKIRDIDPEYSLDTGQFAGQIALLREKGYRSADLTSLTEGNKSGERRCLITFDDGYIGNYTNAFPVLVENGFKAVFFVAARYIGSSEYWMSWDQLREMAAQGYSIQSHTWSHPALESLDEKAVLFELAESKRVIEDEIGQPVHAISLPFGSYNKSLFAIARSAGYSVVLTSSMMSSGKVSNPAVFGRVPIKASYSLATFTRLVERERGLVFRMQCAECAKNVIKKTVGINFYRAIYRRVNRVRVHPLPAGPIDKDT